MANVKISQLTAKGSNIASSDRFAIAQDDGGGTFSSKYVLGSQIHNISFNLKTVNYTLALDDSRKMIEVDSTSNRTITVPLNSVVAFPIGTKVMVSRLNTGTVKIAGSVGVTIHSAGGKFDLAAQYSVATLLKRDTDTWYLYGDLIV